MVELDFIQDFITVEISSWSQLPASTVLLVNSKWHVYMKFQPLLAPIKTFKVIKLSYQQRSGLQEETGSFFTAHNL